MSWIHMVYLFSLSCVLFHGQVHEVEGRKGFKSGDQDWGYVTVRPTAHMFWWLYYVNSPNKTVGDSVFDKPLIIWLQGGPGGSSTGFGNFKEIGPFDIEEYFEVLLVESGYYKWANSSDGNYASCPLRADGI
ncbi:hypothetical protein PV327_009970 [Microctonus hyperodae]|uniref:Uncharacterized protein n=1 Tax=Microctonus hyperodae TaxID=165561 RepID=A0AA39F231_MICHY|nr:hypothetical protein PV327_009970 [Microctonus hyperodae]